MPAFKPTLDISNPVNAAAHQAVAAAILPLVAKAAEDKADYSPQVKANEDPTLAQLAADVASEFLALLPSQIDQPKIVKAFKKTLRPRRVSHTPAVV